MSTRYNNNIICIVAVPPNLTYAAVHGGAGRGPGASATGCGGTLLILPESQVDPRRVGQPVAVDGEQNGTADTQQQQR